MTMPAFAHVLVYHRAMQAIHGKTDDPPLEVISNPPVATVLPVSVLTRRHFFIAAAAFLASVIYGSLIPFHY